MVLIRGNGSPRSFRVSLPGLYRSLTALGFVFATAVLISLLLIGHSLINDLSDPPARPPAPATAAPQANPGPAAEGEEGLWTQLRGAVKPAADSSELEKEVAGLKQDLSDLNARIDGRSNLAAGAPLLQLLSPRSVPVPAAETMVEIKNPRSARDPATKQVTLDFELHNTDPRQRQARGHIVVLAKTSDYLASYPNGVFSPNQNILVNFSKGETFAISRFRQARAAFPLAGLEGKKVSFQIFLFGTDGRVIANAYVEEGR